VAQPAGPDTGKQLGATAEAYVRYVVRRGAGLKLIFAPGLEHLHDEDSIDAGCELMSAAAPPRGELGGPQPTLQSWVNDSPHSPDGYALLFRPRLRRQIYRR
jgi:hypothetical protein